jgi:hypothetical protein
MPKKLFYIICFAICIAIILFGCKPLHLTGQHTLTVKTAAKRGHATLVTFKELKGQWVVPTDTLAPGKKVTINFIHQKK